MNLKELLTNLKTDLKTLVWTGSNKVFGDEVYVVAKFPDDHDLARVRPPACFIEERGATQYEYEDRFLSQGFNLTVVVRNEGDPFGENVLIGGNRTANTSDGAGLLDIETVLLESIRQETALSSNKITLKGTAAPRSTYFKHQDMTYAYKSYEFTCFVSNDSTATDTLRNPGRLFWNPVNIGGGNYGTFLGYLASSPLLDPGYKLTFLPIGDGGVTPQICIYNGNFTQVVAEFLSYNADTIARLFLGMTSSTLVTLPGSIKTGEFFSGSSFVNDLLFVPDDTTNNMAFMLYKAVPIMTNAAKFARGEDTVFKCVFTGLPDASGRILAVGPIGSIPT